MGCPVCHVPLKTILAHGYEIDVCPRCRGILLDPGELNYVVAGLIKSGRVPDDSPARKRPIPWHSIPSEDRACPRCGAAMTTFNYSYDSNVIIDRCGSCRCVWLDRGELLRIAVYRKGHPLQQALGESIAASERERARLRGVLGETYG